MLIPVNEGFRFDPPAISSADFAVRWDGVSLTASSGVGFTAPEAAPAASDVGGAPADGYNASSVVPSAGTAVHVRVSGAAGTQVYSLWFPPGQPLSPTSPLVVDWKPVAAALPVIAQLQTLPEAFSDVQSIRTFFDGGSGVATTNLLAVFAMMLVLLSGGAVFNKAVEVHMPGWGLSLRRLPLPVLAPVRSFHERWSAFAGRWVGAARRHAWMTRIAAPAVLILLTGFIYSLLEPGFGWNQRSLALLVSMVVSQGALALFYEGGKAWLYRRSLHVEARVRLFPACIVIALVSVGISRAVDFQPGFVVGFVASASIMGGATFTREQHGRSTAIVSAGLLGISIAGWLAAVPLHAVYESSPSLWTALPEAAALAVFVVFLQGLLFSLIPLQFMDGASIWRWNRWAWIGLFVPAALLFMQTLFNHQDAYADLALSSRSVTGLAVLGGYMVATFGTWAYFRRRSERAMAVDGD